MLLVRNLLVVSVALCCEINVKVTEGRLHQTVREMIARKRTTARKEEAEARRKEETTKAVVYLEVVAYVHLDQKQ